MRRLIAIVAVQVLATVFAVLQTMIGVRTDEAKYLLDIPYPHPPFARFFQGAIDGFASQEFFLRFAYATLLLQAGWLVYGMARDLSKGNRIILFLLWLGSAAVLIQAGTVMLSVLTAVQAMILVYLLLRPESPPTVPWIVGLYWMMMLFTAFQAILFTPLIVALLRRMQCSWKSTVIITAVPIVLLVLYALTNPLALASMVLVGGGETGGAGVARVTQAAWAMGLSGNVLLGVGGIITIAMSRRIEWIVALILLTLYVLLSPQPYYAVLFAPLWVAGLTMQLRQGCIPKLQWMTGAYLVLGVWMTAGTLSLARPTAASAVLEFLEWKGVEGTVLMAGPFGHEWQYQSRYEIVPYDSSLMEDAAAIVCITECSMSDIEKWQMITHLPVEVFVRRQ